MGLFEVKYASLPNGEAITTYARGNEFNDEMSEAILFGEEAISEMGSLVARELLDIEPTSLTLVRMLAIDLAREEPPVPNLDAFVAGVDEEIDSARNILEVMGVTHE